MSLAELSQLRKAKMRHLDLTENLYNLLNDCSSLSAQLALSSLNKDLPLPSEQFSDVLEQPLGDQIEGFMTVYKLFRPLLQSQLKARHN